MQKQELEQAFEEFVTAADPLVGRYLRCYERMRASLVTLMEWGARTSGESCDRSELAGLLDNEKRASEMQERLRDALGDLDATAELCSALSAVATFRNCLAHARYGDGPRLHHGAPVSEMHWIGTSAVKRPKVIEVTLDMLRERIADVDAVNARIMSLLAEADDCSPSSPARHAPPNPAACEVGHVVVTDVGTPQQAFLFGPVPADTEVVGLEGHYMTCPDGTKISLYPTSHAEAAQTLRRYRSGRG